MSHDVFISYSREDGAFVQRLDALLTSAGVSTWFDRRSLLPGQKWEDVIEDEIPAARVFLACLSATAQDERGYFHVEQQLAARAAMRAFANCTKIREGNSCPIPIFFGNLIRCLIARPFASKLFAAAQNSVGPTASTQPIRR